MATAQAKFTLKCDLCPCEHDINWKCQDCDEWLCYGCKTAHSNSKVSKGHKVISLTAADVTQQQYIRSKFCNDHPEEPYCMYCKDCQHSICLLCITGSHKSHDFVKISAIIDEKKKELYSYLDRVKQNQFADLEKSVKQLKNDQTDYNSKIDVCVSDIRKQGRELKELVDKIIETAISDLEKRVRDDRKFMNEMETEYTQKLSALREMIQTNEKKLKSIGDGTEIIKLVTDVKKNLESYESTKAPIHVTPPSFIFNKPDYMALKNQFGCLDFELEEERASECVTMVTALTPVSHIKVKVISKFQHCYSANHIACWNANKAWIVGGTELTLVRKDGKVVKSIDMVDICYSATSNQGKLLISTKDKIKTLNDNENGLTNYCHTGSVLWGGIYVTADGDIFHCQNTKVVKLSPTGKIKQTIDFKDRKYAGVRNVMHITQNVNGDLWITSISSKCVVVLNSDDKFRFQYKGPTDKKMEKTFDPWELICNKNGQVLIADSSNNKIHLVDREGHFLQFLLTEKDGLNCPKTISQGKNGKIWVGCAKHNTVVVAEYE